MTTPEQSARLALWALTDNLSGLRLFFEAVGVDHETATQLAEAGITLRRGIMDARAAATARLEDTARGIA